MKTYLYRASNLKSTITFLASVVMAEDTYWRPLKTVVSCDLFIIIIIIIFIIVIINFFRRVFSQCTEAITVPLETILPEESLVLAVLCALR